MTLGSPGPVVLKCPHCGGDFDVLAGTGMPARAIVHVGPRTYHPKRCLRCDRMFQPSGPRSELCPSCKAAA